MCQLGQNKKLAATFSGLVYSKEKHNYNTRSARKDLLDISLYQTFTYEMQSCKYQCIKDWNRFKNENSTENLTYPAVNNIVKKNILASYQYFLILDFFFFILLLHSFTELQNQQRMKCNVLFFYYFFFIYFLSLFILIYLSESSESSDCSCDFCQHNPEFEQLM